MNTKWKWSHTYESICNGSLSWTDIISLWSDRVDDTGMFGWKEKAVTDSPQWQEKPSSSAAEQSVRGWTRTERTLVFKSLCMCDLFSSFVWDRPSSVGGEKPAVMWAGPASKNKPCPIGTQEGVYISARLSSCGRARGIHIQSIPFFYRV